MTSLANPVVKLLRSLDRKKQRKETGLFLAEGARLADEALSHGWRPAYAMVAEPALTRPHTRDLVNRLLASGGRVVTVSAKVLEAVSRKDNPQTLLAAFEQRLATLESLGVDGARRWIALYEVRDPGNLGTIIRTADAAGVDGVILIGQCCDPFSVEAVRASMGSLFAMPVVETGFDAFNAWRLASGAAMFAASMRGDRRQDDVAYGARSVILMGNEQSGLPTNVEACCDALVRLPMRGAADSLNLAAATAILTYEVWRQSGYSGADR